MPVKMNKNGSYYFSVRYIDQNGRPQRKKREDKNWTMKQAKEAEREFLNQVCTPNQGELTYQMLLEIYITKKEQQAQPRTILTYQETNKSHILPTFGKMKVSEITKQKINNWQTVLLSRGFSSEYLGTIQSTFKGVLVWGTRNDYIKKNPFTTDFVKGSEEKKEMTYFTPNEFKLFKSVIEDKTDLLMFNLLYWTGMRKGELFGLKFTNIDFEQNLINITGAYNYRHHIDGKTKNRNSIRTIMLTKKLSESLKEYVDKASKIAGFNPNLYLFGLDHPISSTTLSRKKDAYCKIAGVKQIRIHDFRHSHVSLMINEGISDYDIAKRLGHSRDMVNNVYGHWFTANQLKLAKQLDNLEDEIDKIDD